jgi:hypothetical protein
MRLSRARFGDNGKIAKAALMQAPRTAYVTTIALDHGFDEFGRFSVEYRRLFAGAVDVERCVECIA